ncbi:MAG: hypothetical protein JXR38_05540 [Bacilli bacterium]|nr:hypothetical protein [Bacilli bacterium]
MDNLLKEFRSWYKENKELYAEFMHHDSVLFDRFQPVIEVLNHIESEIATGSLEANDDIDKIFGVGLEYINDQFQTVKMYLETYFNDDLHAFLDYDKVINALLYLEDVRYELDEKGLKTVDLQIEQLMEELEAILESGKEVPDTFSLYVDDVLQQAIGDKLSEFVGIIDIFVDVAETFGLYFGEAEDIVIGRDTEGETK